MSNEIQDRQTQDRQTYQDHQLRLLVDVTNALISDEASRTHIIKAIEQRLTQPQPIEPPIVPPIVPPMFKTSDLKGLAQRESNIGSTTSAFPLC